MDLILPSLIGFSIFAGLIWLLHGTEKDTVADIAAREEIRNINRNK